MARIMVDPVRRFAPVRDAVPESLERTILRALARAPADRFSTAGEFAAALAQPRSHRFAVGFPGPGGSSRYSACSSCWASRSLAYPPGRSTSSVVPSASHIAVLPFTPSGPDTALTRLGRDLVFTLSAELDGLGDIRVVDAHTVLAQTARGDVVSPADGAALAQRFGAGSLVRGSLIREGDRVRADFALLPADGRSEPLARGSVTGAVDSVAALTDSAVHTLLKQVWVGGRCPDAQSRGGAQDQLGRGTPGVPRGRTAGGRRFLGFGGDLLPPRPGSRSDFLARGRARTLRQELDASRVSRFPPRRAPTASPRTAGGGTVEHRRDLAWSEDSLALGLQRAQELTQRYPSSWFGWLIYGDVLLHNGPLLGHSHGEALAAFERALERNPNLIPVHEHLMMLALQARDTARAGKAFGELTRLDAGPGLTADGYGSRMLQFRFLLGIARGDSTLTTSLIDSIARDPEPYAGNDGTFYDAFLTAFSISKSACASEPSRLEV